MCVVVLLLYHDVMDVIVPGELQHGRHRRRVILSEESSDTWHLPT